MKFIFFEVLRQKISRVRWGWTRVWFCQNQAQKLRRNLGVGQPWCGFPGVSQATGAQVYPEARWKPCCPGP